MSKLKWIFLIIFCLMTSCKHEEVQKKDALKIYQEYLTMLENQETFSKESCYFETMLVLNKTNKGNIRYDLIIHHPTEPLSHVKVICVPNDFNATQMSAPCLGILEEEDVTLVSRETDKERHLYKGINLSGISENEVKYVRFLIQYEVASHENRTEYLQIDYEIR